MHPYARVTGVFTGWPAAIRRALAAEFEMRRLQALLAAKGEVDAGGASR